MLGIKYYMLKYLLLLRKQYMPDGSHREDGKRLTLWESLIWWANRSVILAERIFLKYIRSRMIIS